eukprot:3628038-Rhodomonas_salina.3
MSTLSESAPPCSCSGAIHAGLPAARGTREPEPETERGKRERTVGRERGRERDQPHARGCAGKHTHVTLRMRAKRSCGLGWGLDVRFANNLSGAPEVCYLGVDFVLREQDVPAAEVSMDDLQGMQIAQLNTDTGSTSSSELKTQQQNALVSSAYVSDLFLLARVPPWQFPLPALHTSNVSAPAGRMRTANRQGFIQNCWV